MRRQTIAACLAAGLALPSLAEEPAALGEEIKRLSARLEALERQNKALVDALDSEHLSENEPALATRLKATESQVLALQAPVHKLDEALAGIAVGGSLTAVLQRANAAGTVSGRNETRGNYRGDLTVTLPGGESADGEGQLFTQFRFGQGSGVALHPTFTSSANTVAFETAAGPDDSFAILAQAWYQWKFALGGDGLKQNSRDAFVVTFGKIDPFVFFDQNGVADDESTRFLNNVFVHNPLLDSGGDVGADAYGFAPGAVFKYENSAEKGGEWALSLGVFAAGPGANFAGAPTRPLLIAQAEKALRLAYLPGSYRLYAWQQGHGGNLDGSENKHRGVGISFDQKVDDELTVFGRFGRQGQGMVTFDRAATLGVEVSGSLWSRSADNFGLAVGALRASDDFKRAAPTLDADGDGRPDFGYAATGGERQVEVYYRARVNSMLELGPHAQWIQRPAANPDGAAIRVIGLRAKVGF